MKTHRSNPGAPGDEGFQGGTLDRLVVGHRCRLLDQRRTPGVIESIDLEGGFFRWRITDFEDQGKSWDMRLESVSDFQFESGVQKLADTDVEILKERVTRLHRIMVVDARASALDETLKELAHLKIRAGHWLQQESAFLRSGAAIDLSNAKGPQTLSEDLRTFLQSVGALELEEKTADNQVLNPSSGEWMCGHHIVMAEMGLKSYRGHAPRSRMLFEGLGQKARRREHILHRLAFLRAFFAQLGLTEVSLYRGMATEKSWRSDEDRLVPFCSSWSFHHKVAHDFADLTQSKNRNGYLLKRVFPIEKLFMTYLETAAMNQQYLEAEALVMHSDADRKLW